MIWTLLLCKNSNSIVSLSCGSSKFFITKVNRILYRRSLLQDIKISPLLFLVFFPLLRLGEIPQSIFIQIQMLHLLFQHEDEEFRLEAMNHLPVNAGSETFPQVKLHVH